MTFCDRTPAGLSRRELLKIAWYLGAGAVAAPLTARRTLARPIFDTYPFALGVASGDPAPDGVVLWTRLAPAPLDGGGMPMADVEVDWEVARDARFQSIARRGTAIARPAIGHSVHVEVEGLEPSHVPTFARDFKGWDADSRFAMDKWDGYVAARQRFYTHIRNAKAPNPIVLSGDVHLHYAADLKMDFEDPRSATIGVELTNTSITSTGDGADVSGDWEAIRNDNPHIKSHSGHRGYIACTRRRRRCARSSKSWTGSRFRINRFG